jgi:hypothetical protein
MRWASTQQVESAGLVHRYGDGGMNTYPEEWPCAAGQIGWYRGSNTVKLLSSLVDGGFFDGSLRQ